MLQRRCAQPQRGGGGGKHESRRKLKRWVKTNRTALSGLQSKGGGTQFTCFTGTKVQILTLQASRGVGGGVGGQEEMVGGEEYQDFGEGQKVWECNVCGSRSLSVSLFLVSLASG